MFCASSTLKLAIVVNLKLNAQRLDSPSSPAFSGPACLSCLEVLM